MSGESTPSLSGAIPSFEVFMTKWESLGNNPEKPHMMDLVRPGLKWAYKYYARMDYMWRTCYYSRVVHSCTRWKWGHNLESSNGQSQTVTILWLRRLTVGLIDCHVIRKTRAVGSTPNKGHCTVLRAQPLLRCVNIWTVYLSPSRLLIAYSFAYACLLMAYSFAYLCLWIAYWFLPSQ